MDEQDLDALAHLAAFAQQHGYFLKIGGWVATVVDRYGEPVDGDGGPTSADLGDLMERVPLGSR